MRSLTELHSIETISDNRLWNALSFFSSLKLFSFNATGFDWSMIIRIFDHTHISLITLNFLSLLEPPPDILYPPVLVTPLGQLVHGCMNSRWAHIRSIDLQNCQCSGEALQYLIRSCRNILKFHLHGSLLVRDANLNLMLVGMPLLECIDFSQLFGVERFIMSRTLHRSLRSLKITRSPFFRVILLDPSCEYSSSLLVSCDFSSTAVTNESISRIVSCSPRLENLILRECVSIVGSLSILSRSLTHMDLQHSSRISSLGIYCPSLTHLHVLGCLNLQSMTINSFELRSLDLSMLTKLSKLEVNCHCISDINFSGCRKLIEAKVSIRSPFSRSFKKKYYRCHNIEEQDGKNDPDFLHFSCNHIKCTVEPVPLPVGSIQPNFVNIRRHQFVQRSSSI